MTSAVLRLAVENLIPIQACDQAAIDQYIRRVELSHTAEALWQAARSDEQLSTPSALRLLRGLNLTAYTNAATWRARGSQFLGATSCKAAEELRRLASRNNRRLFNGSGWEDVLVLPYYDRPDRLCGFLFIGRAGAAEDQVYFSLYGGNEAGVTQLQALDQKAGYDVDQHVFVIADPIKALRLQLRWLYSDARPLPIVGAYCSDTVKTGELWQQITTKRRIYWSDAPDTAFMASVRAADGHVASDKLRHDDPQMQEKPPLEWLRSFQHQPKKWNSALQSRLAGVSDEVALQILFGVGLTKAELLSFIKTCPPHLADRLTRVHTATGGKAQVSVRNRVIQEDDHGWHVIRPAETICNARIRLEQVVRMDNGHAYYRGRVFIKEQWLSFTERLDQVNKLGLFKCLEQHLLQHNVQLIGAPAWNRHAEYIAQQFHAPEVIEGVGAVGWDARRRNFRFPYFVINTDGEATRDNLGLFSGDPPCQDFRPPVPMLTRDRQQLNRRGVASALFWAVTGAILHNTLAPVHGYQPCGIALTGAGSLAANMMARWLGCVATNLPTGSNAHSRLEELLIRHNWPTILLPVRGSEYVRGTFLTTPVYKNCLLELDWLSAKVAESRSDWLIIDSESPSQLPEFALAASQIIPHYLQAKALDQFRVPATTDSRITNILHDLHTWVGNHQHGGVFDLQAALEVITGPGTVPGWSPFLDVAWRYADSIVQSSPHSAHAVINLSSMRNVLTQAEAPDFDWAGICDGLNTEGVLTAGSDTEIVVPSTWWTRQVHTRNQRARRFRLVQ